MRKLKEYYESADGENAARVRKIVENELRVIEEG